MARYDQGAVMEKAPHDETIFDRMLTNNLARRSSDPKIAPLNFADLLNQRHEFGFWYKLIIIFQGISEIHQQEIYSNHSKLIFQVIPTFLLKHHRKTA